MQKADERGVALLLALLVLTLLTALILEFDAEARREYREAAAFRDGYKADMLTRAAVKAAGAVLLQDFLRERTSGNRFDALTDIWAMPIKNYTIGDGTLTAQLEDERGKLNLNDLATSSGNDGDQKKKIGRVKRLFELLQISPNLVDALVDWLDQDEIPQPAGAESLYYQSQKPPYRSANGPLPSLVDLRLVKGFTPEIVERLARYVTILPVEAGGVVNLNTADPIVIQTLDSSITQSLAMEIVQGRPYKTKNDLERVGSFQELRSQLLNDYDVKSDFFSARLTITVNETTKSAFAILKREPSKGASTVEYMKML